MMNIAVLASGNGTNFEALAKTLKKQGVRAGIKVLITDKKNAYVRKRAKRLGVKDVFIDPKEFKSRLEFDKEIIKTLRREKTDIVALAGYMRIISPYFVKSFKNKIINIHPALLPAFKGVDSITRALDYGCKTTGVTVHFVDEKVDHGPIILQEAVTIRKNEILKTLEKRIHKLEHKLYPLAVKLIAEKKLKIKGRNVFIA